MRRRALAGVIGLGFLVGVGCGDDTSTSTAGPGGTGGSGGGGAGGGGGSSAVPCDGAPADLSLGGVWAAYGQLSVTLQGKPGGAITTCPSDQVGESNLLLMLVIQEDPSSGERLTEVKATLCSIELPTVTALVGDCKENPTNLVSTQLIAPQKFIDALPDVASQPVEGSLDGSKPGAGLTLDRFIVTVGSDKGGTDLPSWDATTSACQAQDIGHQTTCETTCVDDCPAMRDDDKDGFAGVTIEVCGFTEQDQSSGVTCNSKEPDVPGATVQGKAFIGIQVDPQFTGKAESSCEITGKVDTAVLYSLVGADVYLAGTPISVASAIKSLPDFQVEVDDSIFRMIRVDGKFGAPDWDVDPSDVQAACAALIKHVNEF